MIFLQMVYLYLINYARSKPDLVKYAMDGFLSVRRRRFDSVIYLGLTSSLV